MFRAESLQILSTLYIPISHHCVNFVAFFVPFLLQKLSQKMQQSCGKLRYPTIFVSE